jgi:hypothetical protein
MHHLFLVRIFVALALAAAVMLAGHKANNGVPIDPQHTPAQPIGPITGVAH